MPTVFRYRGYRFFFYSNEGDPTEPLHIHVRKGEAVAKIWLEPAVAIADSYGIHAGDLRRLAAVAAARKDEIREYWHDHFGN